MAVALKSPLAPLHLDKHWSPSDFVDTSSCPSLALNSPVSSMASDSIASSYMPSTSEEHFPPTSTVSHDMLGSSWYGPTTTQCEVPFENPYITPLLGSFSPPEYSRSSGAFPRIDTKVSDSPYGFSCIYESGVPARPRSSPSTFSPTSGARPEEDFLWQQPNGLGISQHQNPTMNPFHTPYNSARSRDPRRSEPTIPSMSDVHAPIPNRRPYPIIAPNPVQPMRPNKRMRESVEPADESKSKRPRSDSAAVTQELTEEDKLLLQLKDEENLPWKDIAARFQTDIGKSYQIPALQMRLKRLRERLRVWTEADLKALRLAHDYWIQSKYEIIASKMLEYGASDRWSARQCARKWQEIDPGPTPYTSSYETPMQPYTASPQMDAPTFLPYLHIPQ